jgi:hypothetical protein
MGDVLHLVDPRLRVADELAGALAACLEGARDLTPRDADWRCVVGQALADLIRRHDLEREVLAGLLSPHEFHAWEALTAALNAWPGPGPTVARAWKRFALAATDEEREEAREELRRHGIDPPGPDELRR